MTGLRAALVSLLSILFLQAAGPAQQAGGNCAMPSFSNVVHDPNIFNEQQEEWLGEIVAPQVEKRFNVIADPQTDYLQKLGYRLLAQLTPTTMHYHFTIIDLPDTNSFGLPGGYIYLSRRIVALAQNEDELAGLLGHEIGHIITHQSAIDISRTFKEVLGVTQVGDRKDILDKWNQLLDSVEKKSSRYSEKREQQEQLIADRIAIYAMTRAGYQPARFADFFDRLTQTKGNKGNFWSDLFGATSPESKRLRELVRNAAPLPLQCVTAVDGDANARYLSWQQAVIGAGLATGKEEIPGLLNKVSLTPPLRSDLQQIQVSPDGRFLLAQDDSSVFVLTREPLANLFRFDAPNADHAQFSPDSHSIVFVDKELRVEKWDVEAKQRTSVHQVTLPVDCQQKALAPSGDVLACLTLSTETQLACHHMTESGTFEVTGCDVPVYELQLIDVNANNTIFTRKSFYSPSAFEAFVFLLSEALGLPSTFAPSELQFSPDGRYFAAGHGANTLAWDLSTRSEMKLTSKIKSILGLHFAFKGSGEIDGFNFADQKAVLYRYRFPSGEPIDQFLMPVKGALGAPAKGEYLLLLNTGNSPVAVIDLQAKKITMGYKVPGFTVYDQSFAAESIGGGMVIANLADSKTTAQLRLPFSPLHTSKVAAFSSNGKWLAISGPNRGGVWDLSTGKRAFYSDAFDGAVFDQDQLVIFTQRERAPGKITEINTATLQKRDLFTLPSDDQSGGDKSATDLPPLSHSRKFQLGALLISTSVEGSKKEKGINYLLEVFDVRTNNKLWDRKFGFENPKLGFSRSAGTLTLLFSSHGSIKEQAKDDAALGQRWNSLPGKEDKRKAYAVIVVEGSTGKSLGSLLVDTGGAFKITSAMAAGDTVVAGDSDNRTLVYSLKSGELKGKVFGTSQAVSRDGKRILVDKGKGETELYDATTLQMVGQLRFPSRIVHAEFSDDGNNMMVLTGDEMVYSLKTPGAQEAAAIH